MSTLADGWSADTLATVLQLAGLVCAVTCAVCLFIGSRDLPLEIHSWKGDSEAEQSFKRRRRRFATVGFVLLALAFAFQTAGVLIAKA